MKKYALVTGCDRGVGLALATQLIERGYYVFAGRYDQHATQLIELEKQYTDSIMILNLDISNIDSVKAAAELLKQNCPHLDMIINNAGILGDFEKQLEEELDYEEMLLVYNTNTLGPLRVCSELCTHLMKGNQKLIVTISSEAGSIADCWRENWFAYGLSKSALNMEGAMIHNHIRKDGGRVILMHPGHVKTYMRGELDTTGKIDATESAKGILTQVLDQPLPEIADRPIYMDYTGKLLPW